MHLLIPFAGTLDEAGLQAQAGLQLPRLRELLPWLVDSARDEGEPESLSPPHERALAGALGLAGADGCIPWAAHLAALDAVDTGERAVGLLTPTHWQVGSDRVVLLDPDLLDLDEAASRAVFDAVRPLFESEGLALRWGAPLRWYLLHESLAGLPTASLDRAIGRNLEDWLPPRGHARLLRRLQNEVQMQLYTHPVGEGREMPVNSFWISGCGVRQHPRGPAPQVDSRLRAPLLSGDWTAWTQAWAAIDAGPVAALLDRVKDGEDVSLTLCGERSAVRFTPRPRGWADRLRRRWQSADVAAVLGTL